MMFSVSDLKVDIEGSRILNGISLSVAAGELVCRALEHHDGLEREFRFFK
jgi:branched-chain amino acid transport system ATP-binding protein